MSLLQIIVFLSVVSAQSIPTQSAWGQCGGIGWTGPIICPPAYPCTFQSDWFYQCRLPLSTTSTSLTTSSNKIPTTTKSLTTSTKKLSSSTTTKSSITSKSTISLASSAGSTSLTSRPSLSPTTLKTSTSAIPTPVTAPLWAQCGGRGWTGPTVCAYGAICVYANEWHSQCLRDPAITITPSSTTSRPPPSPTSTKPPQTFAYMFVFGDSYSQTGFDITGIKPSLQNQIGNPRFPGWTTSGGRNWVGYLTSSNVNLLAYNFASGGATTDAALVAPFAPTVLSFVDQVAQFTTNLVPAPAYVPWESENSLFAIWIGVNDVGNAWYRDEWPALCQKIVDRYFEQVQVLYNSGARKFAFLNVPPIEKTPAMLLQDVANQQAEAVAIADFNNLLQLGRDRFVAANTGLTNYYTQVMDTQNPFNVIIENPAMHGAPNASCYNEDGVSCLWWNDYHPGLHIQQNVAGKVSDVGLYPCCGNTGV